MNVGEIIGEALDYPGSNLKKVLGLGALIIISLLIIPIFLVYGYNLRVLKATIAGFDELPDFDEWGDMLIDGLKVFVVSVAYMLIPLIVIFSAVYLTNSNPTAGVIIAVIGIILAIIFGLVEQIAIAHMAFNDSLGAAFQIGEILNIISEIGWVDYVIWYIAVIIIGGIGFVASFIIGIIPLIGPIISFVLTAILLEPYLNLFYYRAIGLRYAYE